MIPEAHLPASLTSKRDLTIGRAFRLNDVAMPSRSTFLPPTERAKQMLDIVRYLNVEKSARYQPIGQKTFCNIYACDYCYLSGVYLPRVWWTESALASIDSGAPIVAKYGVTVTELNANALYRWLVEYGEEFGWKPLASTEQLQQSANSGKVVVVCARRTNPSLSGHINMVVPEESPLLVAKRNDSVVTIPLQSQAGVRNYCFSCAMGNWWRGSQFKAFGFWVHE